MFRSISGSSSGGDKSVKFEDQGPKEPLFALRIDIPPGGSGSTSSTVSGSKGNAKAGGITPGMPYVPVPSGTSGSSGTGAGATGKVTLPRNAPPLVQQWKKELVLDWLNNFVLPMLTLPPPPTDPLTSATPTSAKPPLSAHDLALLDSVFNIGDLPMLSANSNSSDKKGKPLSPAMPPLTLKDLNRVSIRNGADLILAPQTTLKELFKKQNLNEGQFSLVLDSIAELKWHNDTLRRAAIQTSRQPILPQNPVVEVKKEAASETRPSFDVSRLIINRAPRTLDTAPARSFPLDIERNVFANVMNPSAAKIWETCLKVYLIGMGDKLTTMIDISTAKDGAGIRAKILGEKKFRLPAEMLSNMAIYAAKDAAGSYDADQPLNDETLYLIAKASDINMKHLTLTTRTPLAPLIDDIDVVRVNNTPPASPRSTLRLPWRASQQSINKPVVVPSSPIASVAKSHRSFLDPSSLTRSSSVRTFNDTASIASTTYHRMSRRDSASVFSTGSKAFPGERPAVETIAQNLELYFPQMQPLDTSDAMQGVLWYNEKDVSGGNGIVVDNAPFHALYGDDEDGDDEEEISEFITRVSSIRKADVAANSLYGSGSLRDVSRMSRRGSLGTMRSRIPMPGSPFGAQSFVSGPAGVEKTGRKAWFKEQLAKLGTGGLFMTREASTSSAASVSSSGSVLSKKISRQHLVSNLAQVGLLQKPKSAGSSPAASAQASPVEVRSRVEFDAVENFRSHLSSLVEGDQGSSTKDNASMDSDDDNEAHIISFDGSEIDVYNSFASSEGDAAEKPVEDEDSLHIRWKGFLIKPNPSVKSDVSVRIAKTPLGGTIDRDTDPSGSETMMSVNQQVPEPIDTSNNAMQVDVSLSSQPPVTGQSDTLIQTPSSLQQSMPSLTITSDSPSIFTDDDISPPKRRSIRWLKGDMIGKGSFGRVYYGVNLNTQEVMAVKQIDVIPVSRYRNKAEAGVNRQKMIESLRSEILLLNELQHENVVRYLGFDIDQTLVSVFLEYVSGGSVASMIARFGSFEEPLAQMILHQVLHGLEYLHDRSIIHRDIKGSNILVNMDGTVKISDFGISKKNELNMAYQLNSKMEFAGSVFWMAPEMSQNSGYSAKIDIWALGCVALEMLSGKYPWSGKGHMQVMWELKQGNTPPIPSGLSREAMVFLAHSFKIDPEERPTAAQLYELSSFVQIDPYEFEFEQWWEEKEQLAKLQDTTSSIYSD